MPYRVKHRINSRLNLFVQLKERCHSLYGYSFEDKVYCLQRCFKCLKPISLFYLKRVVCSTKEKKIYHYPYFSKRISFAGFKRWIFMRKIILYIRKFRNHFSYDRYKHIQLNRIIEWKPCSPEHQVRT